MREQITNDVLTCTICQTQKKQSKKYGLLPERDAEAMPWDLLCVDLIGPYNIKSNLKGVKIPPLKSITLINLATRLNNAMIRHQSQSLTLLSKNGSHIIHNCIL
jgi:hypothetical protein